MKIITPKTYFYFTLGGNVFPTPLFVATFLYFHIFDNLENVIGYFIGDIFVVLVVVAMVAIPFLLLIYGLFLLRKSHKKRLIAIGIVINVLFLVLVFYALNSASDTGPIGGSIPIPEEYLNL